MQENLKKVTKSELIKENVGTQGVHELRNRHYDFK